MSKKLVMLLLCVGVLIQAGFAECDYYQDKFENAVFTYECLELRSDEFNSAVKAIRDEFISSPESRNHGMFFKVPHKSYPFNPNAVLKELGFSYYGGDDKEVIWVIKNGSPIPEFATATAGSKALLIRKGKDGQEELLLIIEKNDKFPKWELSGGWVDKIELIEEAGQRELLEEVGLKARFERILALINYMKGLGDMTNYCFYSMYRLAEGVTGDDLVLQEKEISKAHWISISEILRSEENDNPINGYQISSNVRWILNIYLGENAEHREEVPHPRVWVNCVNSECDASDVVRYYDFTQSRTLNHAN